MFEVIKETNPYGSVDDILKIENTESTQIEYTFGNILTIDNEYTFSLWVRSTGATKTSVHISDQTSEFNLTSEWRRIKFTAQSNIAASKEVYFSIAPNTTLYCYEGQLESGNVATDFKLNPADLMASIDEVDSSLSVLQTDFKVEQGKIETLIKDTTIDGTKLKDKYLETVKTVDGINITINSLETDVDSLTSKTTTIETSVNGIKTQVTAATTKANEASKTANEAQTLAEQNADKFTWIVKSGSNETNFTLTDRTAKLVADNINLKGLVTFNGLNKDTQDKINKAVGTNLFKNTKDFGKPTDYSDLSAYPIVDEKYEQFTVRGTDSITSDMTVTFSTKWKGFNYGDEFTFSFYAKGNLDHMVCYFYGDSGYVKASVINSSNNKSGGYADGRCDFGKLTSEWKRYWVAWKIDSTGDLSVYKTVLIRSDGSKVGQSVYVCGLKFEKGRTPTDWTPSPDDKADQSIIDAWGGSEVKDDVTQINGGYIQTNTINAEQLNVENIFSSGSAAMNIINAQEINANRITSGTIKANYLELYGLSVLQKETNLVTLSIDSDGNTTMRGTVESYNYNAGKTGWSIKNTGDAEFNDVVVRGSVITNDGGIVSSGGSGENLIENTVPDTAETHPITSNWTAEIVEDSYSPTGKAMEVTCKTAGTGGTYHACPKLEAGKTYTWTVYVMASKDCSMIIGQEQGGVIDVDVTTSWQKVSHTFTAYNADHNMFVFYIKSNTGSWDVGDTLSYCSLKLEEGSVPTSWSPAPSDGIKQVRFWAGSSYESRESAPFIVYNDGSVKATRGEFGGVFSGTVEIGNITIEDPSKTAGGDALLTIQNGQNGVKRIQLKDAESSTFAQNIIISDNQYNSKITLNQDGSGTFTSGVYIGDSSTSLLANQLNLKGNILSSETGGFYFDSSQVSIGTTSHNSLLNVRGNIQSSGNISLDGTLSFGDVVTFKPLSNGLDINVLK